MNQWIPCSLPSKVSLGWQSWEILLEGGANLNIRIEYHSIMMHSKFNSILLKNGR